jgi:hypothetical protein
MVILKELKTNERQNKRNGIMRGTGTEGDHVKGGGTRLKRI